MKKKLATKVTSTGQSPPLNSKIGNHMPDDIGRNGKNKMLSAYAPSPRGKIKRKIA